MPDGKLIDDMTLPAAASEGSLTMRLRSTSAGRQAAADTWSTVAGLLGEVIIRPEKSSDNRHSSDTGPAHVVTIGDIPILERFQVSN